VHTRGFAIVVLTAALVAGCSSSSKSSESKPGTSSTTTTPVAKAELRDATCSFKPAIAGAECHTLVVPADRTGASAGTYTLPVVVLKANGPSPASDAVVSPSGGPGYAGLPDASFYAKTSLRKKHDIVLYDQRGMGDAKPSLDCPEREKVFIANLAVADPVEEENARYDAAMAACKQRLEKAGVDLDLFSTPISAADLRDLRETLGYQQWDVLGVSYGSRLALEMLRADPAGTRAAIIDSAYIPGKGGRLAAVELAKDATARLAAACASDAVCAPKHPDLAKEIADLEAKADANPIKTTVTLDDGTKVPLTLTGSDIAGALFNAQYDETLIPILPTLVSGLLAGDTSVVPEIGRRAIPFVNTVSEGAYFAVDCADNAPLGIAKTDADAPATAGDNALNAILTPNCEQWDVASVPSSFTTLPHAKVPMLALAGSLDPITPPKYTKAAADAATGPVTFAEFKGNGHGQWNSNDCARSIVAAFLADPAAKPDTSCVATHTFAFAG
jgi:pimeloyl-ACP methyl ester carboxylesterase